MTENRGFIQESDSLSIGDLILALRRSFYTSAILFGAGLILTLTLPVVRQSESFTCTATLQISAYTFSLLRKAEIVNVQDAATWISLASQDPGILSKLNVVPSVNRLPEGYRFALEGELARFAVTDRSAEEAIRQAKEWARLTSELLRETVNRSRQRVASVMEDLIKKDRQKSEEMSNQKLDREILTREMEELKKSIRTVRESLEIATAATQGDWLVLKDLQEGPPVYTEQRSKKFLIAAIGLSLFLAIGLPLAFNFLQNVVTPLNLPSEVPAVFIPQYSNIQEVEQNIHFLCVAIQLKRKELFNGRPIVVAITAADQFAGRTALCMKLAELAKTSGEQVVAVDADPGGNSLTELSGARTSESIFSLSNTADLKALPTSAKGGYAVLPAKDAGMLGAAAASRAFECLRESYNLIFVDTPLLPCSGNASSVIQAADLTLIVARSRRTRVPAINQSFELLKLAGGRNSIYVLNGIDKSELRSCGLPV